MTGGVARAILSRHPGCADIGTSVSFPERAAKGVCRRGWQPRAREGIMAKQDIESVLRENAVWFMCADSINGIANQTLPEIKGPVIFAVLPRPK